VQAGRAMFRYHALFCYRLQHHLRAEKGEEGALADLRGHIWVRAQDDTGRVFSSPWAVSLCRLARIQPFSKDSALVSRILAEREADPGRGGRYHGGSDRSLAETWIIGQAFLGFSFGALAGSAFSPSVIIQGRIAVERLSMPPMGLPDFGRDGGHVARRLWRVAQRDHHYSAGQDATASFGGRVIRPRCS